MRTTAMLLVLLALAAPCVRAQEQDEPQGLEQRIADASLALRERSYDTLLAGRVRDRMTGGPIAGASVGADVWRAGAFVGEDLSDVAPLLTDGEGQFAGLLPWQPFAGIFNSSIHVLVEAAGYVPSVVRFARRFRFDELGYGLEVEMDRELVLDLLVTDETGAPWTGGEIAWLLLSHDAPCREGTALLDAQGRGIVRTRDFSRPDGLALHVWTPLLSTRVVLPAVGEVARHDPHVTVRCELRRTPPPIRAAISTVSDLQERDIGFLELGCGQSVSHADAFELTLVSLEDAPGPPVRHAWNGRPTSIELPTVPGRTRATVRLDRTSEEFHRLDAGRERLDAGPDFARGSASITEEHPHLPLDESRTPYGSDRVPDDVRRIASARRREDDAGAPKLPPLAKDRDEVTLELPETSGSEELFLFPLVSGVRVGLLRARNGVFRMPRSWLETVEHAVLEPRGRLRDEELGSSRFARGPVLLQRVATSDPDAHRLRLAPRVDRLTVVVKDAAGDPVPDLTLSFRGKGIFDRSAATAPWGFAFEAMTGLPHATMMTDASGELRLRDVPTGEWTLDLLGRHASYLRRQVVVAPGTSRVVLSVD